MKQTLRVLGVAALVALVGCTKDLLEVTDPDIILDETLKASSASGAQGLHNGAILRLEQATAGTQQPDALFVFGGLLTELGWRWTFLLPVPIAAALLAAAPRMLPPDIIGPSSRRSFG